MAVVEIRCPRCGSVIHVKNEKTHEYSCDHCNTTFVFVDTTKREVVRDTKRHNCPICGRPVKMDEGYVCTECGTSDLCRNCVDDSVLDNKTICADCIEKEERNCWTCNKIGYIRCVVCGERACGEHSFIFDIKGEWGSWKYFSLNCPTCDGHVCHSCYVEKIGFLSGKAYYCKKCGSKLAMDIPEKPSHQDL